ncbi:hypothetical protein CDA63_00010 [Hymenobacter amundsenii]|uniref:VWFA domain-containing protein n=1 Tax=Hymenobacter amundsenii TaxID=2006685 RepID=A0A246FSQ2_9BACT|nr:VWA domain-containing protein [Hymenobacter amundsenii]OWP64784.1 hypothetical protein CDA63_00010 [Hymenobacter amundsenii]
MKTRLQWALVGALPFLLGACSGALDSSVSPTRDLGVAPPPSGSNPTQPQAGVLTAGEWNDLRNWSFWINVLKRPEWSPLPDSWQLYPTTRYTLTLTDAAGQPLPGAQVTLGSAAATTGVTVAITDRLGRAELFPGLFQKDSPAAAQPVLVAYRGQQFTLAPLAATEYAATRALPVGATAASAVDIMFVVDATGSMGDEITYLQAELGNVIPRVVAQLPSADIRMSSVFYRDQGDAYLTRVQPFTTKLSELQDFVQAQRAGGGGDFPEAVDEGLRVALDQQWRPEASCRLLFLVLDAPPHGEARTRMQTLIREAAGRGIRLIPVTASGIDTSTEFLMRSLALSTAGTYVFLTDHSGIGDKHLTATVGEYKVEFLNNLLVRLITEYSQP